MITWFVSRIWQPKTLPKRFVFTVMDKWVLFFRISLALLSWTFSKFCPLTSKIWKKDEGRKISGALHVIQLSNVTQAFVSLSLSKTYWGEWELFKKNKPIKSYACRLRVKLLHWWARKNINYSMSFLLWLSNWMSHWMYAVKCWTVNSSKCYR